MQPIVGPRSSSLRVLGQPPSFAEPAGNAPQGLTLTRPTARCLSPFECAKGVTPHLPGITVDERIMRVRLAFSAEFTTARLPLKVNDNSSLLRLRYSASAHETVRRKLRRAWLRKMLPKRNAFFPSLRIHKSREPARTTRTATWRLLSL